jgi:hypothetical protein
LGCCAGHQGLHSEAISASRATLALNPIIRSLSTIWAGRYT